MNKSTTTLFIAIGLLLVFNSCKKHECETCDDGIQNQNETGVDCGGMCQPCSTTGGEKMLTLQPGAADGKDAVLGDGLPDNNSATHPEFSAYAWTCGGSPCKARSVIDFNLASIPTGATVTGAYLSLYSWNSHVNGTHSAMSGSNAATLQRITSSWDENTVTWNTEPSVTTTNQVTLAATTSDIQNYENIDVTALVQDMVNDPDNSHGFYFKIINEQYYRRMVFASSDNTDSNLHPKLVVKYK